ncbi:MAG TPA: DUF5763 domain-containing protein [Chitinispirillaceae bacterium]|nr:DUF5763 domain-containing protein [Chitinispirillaceae bacterium]
MSSQCKGITKSGTPCKMTIVLPNGYCRLHQGQYIVEKQEDTKESAPVVQNVENEALKENVPEKKSNNVDAIPCNSTSYSRNSSRKKRWYIIPVLVIAFFWIVSRFLRKKK